MEKEKRDLLVKQLNYFNEEADKVYKQIKELDHDERKARMLTCVGKCYNANQNFEGDKFPHVLFVYGMSDTLQLHVLEVRYSLENETYYSIDTNSCFDPTDPAKDYMADAVEIPPAEFLKHYDEVQRRIKLAMERLIS